MFKAIILATLLAWVIGLGWYGYFASSYRVKKEIQTWLMRICVFGGVASAILFLVSILF